MKQNKYYRITYNGEGIYNALKKNISLDEWKNLLKSEKINWLPKPPNYAQNNKSYFTQKGYEQFFSLVFKIIIKYLDKEKIKVEQVDNLESIIYEDEFQIVVNN